MNRLDAIAELAREAGADAIAADARALSSRIAEKRFYVACVGQFKRGKSTLVNALVEDAILPVGVLPVTAVVTVLRHGPREVRIRIGGDWHTIAPPELADWVTEERNPGNQKGVRGVEVFVPTPLLASGMCLVDTPGLGSVFAANSDATRAFVPHVDAALVVLGADPPISGEELALVEDVGRHVAHPVLVLNKADRMSPDENAEAARFAERIVTDRLHRPIASILQVSATERLAGAGPRRDWDKLVAALQRLAAEAGAALVAGAGERGAGRLLDRLARELAEQRGALERPRADSERRIAALRRAVAEAERALGDLGHLLRAEEERLGRIFAARRDALLARPMPRSAPAPETARGAAHEVIDGWRRATEPEAEELYREAAARFVDLANAFLARLAEVPGLEGLPRALPAEVGFRARASFCFNELLHVALPGPLASRRRRERATVEYLERLIETNSARVMNDWRDRVHESRRQLEAEVRARLRDIVTSAERALERAAAVLASGAEATSAARARLDSLEPRVAALRKVARAEAAG